MKSDDESHFKGLDFELLFVGSSRWMGISVRMVVCRVSEIRLASGLMFDPRERVGYGLEPYAW
jgi:hypothetical protein